MDQATIGFEADIQSVIEDREPAEARSRRLPNGSDCGVVSTHGKNGETQSGDATGQREEVWLLGLPLLERYLEFVENNAIDGANADRAALVNEWRAANDYYQELERVEAGIANQVQRSELDPAMVAMAEQLKSTSAYFQTFNSLPTTFAMVELDRLVVYQKHVSRTFIDTLKSRLTPAPDAQALFRFCLPTGKQQAPVEIRRVGPRRFVFRCESTDFRFHDPALLRPDQLTGYETSGPIAGTLGLAVGFGSNFLNVISVGKRLLLNNGYHRVCAMREMGITHAPCIVQSATRVDELGIIVKRDVAQQAEFYFESARPPLLKDYFDPGIRKVLPVRKRIRQIELRFEVENDLVVE